MILKKIFPILLSVSLLILAGCGQKKDLMQMKVQEYKTASGDNYQKGQVSSAQDDITIYIARALDMYRQDTGFYPSTLDRLDALIDKPSNVSNWNGPYLSMHPVDPWGREYRYAYPGKYGYNYDLYSLGPDGKKSDDDITNWNNRK